MSENAKYRIVEFLPGTFGIQQRGRLWGWSWATGYQGFRAEWCSVEKAEETIKRWMENEAHVPRVVKEFP